MMLSNTFILVSLLTLVHCDIPYPKFRVGEEKFMPSWPQDSPDRYKIPNLCNHDLPEHIAFIFLQMTSNGHSVYCSINPDRSGSCRGYGQTQNNIGSLQFTRVNRVEGAFYEITDVNIPNYDVQFEINAIKTLLPAMYQVFNGCQVKGVYFRIRDRMQKELKEFGFKSVTYDEHTMFMPGDQIQKPEEHYLPRDVKPPGRRPSALRNAVNVVSETVKYGVEINRSPPVRRLTKGSGESSTVHY